MLEWLDCLPPDKKQQVAMWFSRASRLDGALRECNLLRGLLLRAVEELEHLSEYRENSEVESLLADAYRALKPPLQLVWFKWKKKSLYITTDSPSLGEDRIWWQEGYYKEEVVKHTGVCDSVIVKVWFHWIDNGQPTTTLLGEFDGDSDHIWKDKAEKLWLHRHKDFLKGKI